MESENLTLESESGRIQVIQDVPLPNIDFEHLKTIYQNYQNGEDGQTQVITIQDDYETNIPMMQQPQLPTERHHEEVQPTSLAALQRYAEDITANKLQPPEGSKVPKMVISLKNSGPLADRRRKLALRKQADEPSGTSSTSTLLERDHHEPRPGHSKKVHPDVDFDFDDEVKLQSSLPCASYRKVGLGKCAKRLKTLDEISPPTSPSQSQSETESVVGVQGDSFKNILQDSISRLRNIKVLNGGRKRELQSQMDRLEEEIQVLLREKANLMKKMNQVDSENRKISTLLEKMK